MRKVWKLSPMDIKSYTRWDDYTEARDDMFVATDTEEAPWWWLVRRQRRALNIISHLLSMIPYEEASQA
jgi:polyphosphate kinase 2 (PPK2 family)